MAGVDRDADPLARQGADDGNGAGDFFVGGNGRGARAGGFPADIDDGSTFGDQPAAMGDGGFSAEIFAAVGKTVRRGIDDPHHLGDVEG